MQILRDSEIRKQEGRKNDIKQKIKDSYISNKNPIKNQMIDYKKKLEMLKNNQNAKGAKSPKIKKTRKGTKLFFDENLDIKDLSNIMFVYKTEENRNFENSDLSNFKFITQNKNDSINNIDQFVKSAKRISKDDFNQSKYYMNTSGNINKR